MGFEWKGDGHLITAAVILGLINDVAALAKLHPLRGAFRRPFYLGGSSLIASNSDMDFFLKHGAKSSSSKSPWQPVSAATFFFTESGSRWIAHGDNAEPLIKIARCIKSGKVTEQIRDGISKLNSNGRRMARERVDGLIGKFENRFFLIGKVATG